MIVDKLIAEVKLAKAEREKFIEEIKHLKEENAKKSKEYDEVLKISFAQAEELQKEKGKELLH